MESPAGPRSVNPPLRLAIHALAAATGVIGPVAFGLQKADHVFPLAYFSNIAAALVALGAVLTIARPVSPLAIGMRDSGAASSLLSGVVFLTVIMPHNGYAVWTDPWSIIDNTSLHVVGPALAVACILVDRAPLLGRRAPSVLAWSVVPLAYLATVEILWALGVAPEVPYAFLSVPDYGFPTVVGFVAALLAIFTAIALVVWALKARAARTRGPRTTESPRD